MVRGTAYRGGRGWARAGASGVDRVAGHRVQGLRLGGLTGGARLLDGSRVRLLVPAVLSPPLLARLGQGVDRVVVDELARERLGVLALDRGAVVLAPVGHAALGVVGVDLVHPALADE